MLTKLTFWSDSKRDDGKMNAESRNSPYVAFFSYDRWVTSLVLSAVTACDESF
jgi:hypothetical protein